MAKIRSLWNSQEERYYGYAAKQRKLGFFKSVTEEPQKEEIRAQRSTLNRKHCPQLPQNDI